MRGTDLAIGIDFGASTLKVGVVYQSHVIDQEQPISTLEFDTPDALIEVMVKAVGKLRDRHPGVVALGAGVPGFVNFDRGLVHNLTNVPGWVEIPLQRLLEEKTGMPTVVDNRANCVGVAEWRCGVARGLKDVVFINAEIGVGGAIIANSQIIRGSRFGAGEIGQCSIDWQGKKGEYGNLGALEEYTGSLHFAEAACQAYAEAGIKKTVPECSLCALIFAAHKGCPVANAHWDWYARVMASAAMNCCWLLNPEAVVIGGSVTRAGELFFRPFRDRLFEQLSGPFKDHLMVVPSAFGPEAGTIGAAAIALDGADVLA
ncbi:MAG: ROK family protein [Verrucomicrobiales bacterium]|nr:ROK family protein [Verrucomicrobiota bacterium JB025]